MTIVHQFAAAINRHDLEALVELMAEDHVFVDSLGSRVEGRQNMLKGWQAYFGMVPDYTITIQETFEQGSVVVALGSAQGTFAPHGELLPENRWSTPAAWRAEMRAGKIAEWRVYADNQPIRDIMRRAAK